MIKTRSDCSRGWGARCAASTGKRCTCACGGRNHGGLRKSDHSDDTLQLTPDSVLNYTWGQERSSRPQFPVPDDRMVECVRLTKPGPWGDVESARVYLLEGKYREQLPRRLVKHSPTGFEWGYSGSGPADLALNILALVVTPKEAWHFHQDFKRERIATMPRDGGWISLLDVRVWLDRQYDAEEVAAYQERAL